MSLTPDQDLLDSYTVHAEETLASLNFSPDAFTTKADNVGHLSIDAKDPQDFDDASDMLKSTPMYFVSNLPNAENGQSIMRDSKSGRADRSFFDTF